MQKQAEFVLITGDLNIHHKSWLKYSSDDTSRGQTLRDICGMFGLKQMVKAPTRGEYLLDLVLTSHPKCVAKVGPQVSDHNCVIISLPDSLETRSFTPRQVWQYDDAN